MEYIYIYNRNSKYYKRKNDRKIIHLKQKIALFTTGGIFR